MKLIDDFAYEDPNGRKWTAPTGSIIDGASIPAPLWSVVGSPYTGEYRRAAIVHDVACGTPDVPRSEADEMFYVACLAGGCTKRQARLLYVGVTLGSWVPDVRLWARDEAFSPQVNTGGEGKTLTAKSVQTTFDEIAADIEARPEDTPFEVIREIVEKHLAAKASQ